MNDESSLKSQRNQENSNAAYLPGITNIDFGGMNLMDMGDRNAADSPFAEVRTLSPSFDDIQMNIKTKNSLIKKTEETPEKKQLIIKTIGL